MLHQFDFVPTFAFLFHDLWHTKSNGFNRKHGFLYSPYFWKTWTSIYSIFGVKNGTLYLAKKKGNDMAHLEKYNRSQLGHILKHDSRAKDQNGNYIKFGNEEIDTNRTHLNYNLHERKDGLSDYEFVKNRAMEFLAKNVRNREDVNWVGSWVITLPESLHTSSEADKRKFFEVCHDFLGNRYGFDNIVGAYVHMDETTPHMHTKITPVIYDEKKNKHRHSAKDMFNRTDLKSFHEDLSVRLEREFGFDVGVYENKREDERLPNKSIKELKAENKKLAELKNRMFAEAEKQNDEIKRLKRENERQRERNELLKQEMNQTGLLAKSKSKLFEKDVDRALEIADTLTEERTQEYKARAIKAETEAAIAQRERKEALIENKKWSNGYGKLKSENENLRSVNEYLKNENKLLHSVVKTMQRAFDKVEKFLKSLNIWDRFKRSYRSEDLKQYQEFQSIRHDNDLHANKKVRNHGLDEEIDSYYR